jgi:hypothetical protein
MPLSILLTCSEEYQPAVRDLSSFLWDVVMLHDRLFMFWQNPSAPTLYSPGFYRRWRRLRTGLELRLGKLSRGSPIEIELIVATAGGLILAAKTFAEILRIIRAWRYEQKKQRLEIRQTKLKILQTKIEILEKIESQERTSKLLILLDRDIHRLLGNPIKIIEVAERELREG